MNVRYRIPDGSRATAVTLHSPDKGQSTKLDFRADSGKIAFTAPENKVYAVVSVQLMDE